MIIKIIRKIIPIARTYAVTFLAISSFIISVKPKIDIKIDIRNDAFANISAIKIAIYIIDSSF
jgi:hypothetical protein